MADPITFGPLRDTQIYRSASKRYLLIFARNSKDLLRVTDTTEVQLLASPQEIAEAAAEWAEIDGGWMTLALVKMALELHAARMAPQPSSVKSSSD
jgi:hypothetical protein